ncbi:hypothetical protein B7494_g2473 [Chlorociboria aeruginascens]|nr:hypothetical protein B7494_g2473 [Chlorociboria aeruginascens]
MASDEYAAKKLKASRSKGGCYTCKYVSRLDDWPLCTFHSLRNNCLRYLVQGLIRCTNRVRRVKCDEGQIWLNPDVAYQLTTIAKPACYRCKKFGRPCDGYEYKKLPVVPRRAPKPSSRRDQILLDLAPLLPISRPLSTLKFTNSREEVYYHLYYTETAYDLSGGSESTLWNRLVLQACTEEPCILHCVIAISALDRSRKSHKRIKQFEDGKTDHEFALGQYGKALKEIRETINRGEKATRTVLIASLLIFCFENCLGDVRLALANVQKAVDLMYNWLERAKSPSSLDSPDKSHSLSPAPNTIEDEIVAAFARLDVHLQTWTDDLEPRRHYSGILKYDPPALPPIPLFFTSLSEATIYWGYVVKQAFDFYARVADEKEGHAPMMKVHGCSDSEEAISTTRLLQAFVRAFSPLLQQALSPFASKHDRITIITLGIHSITMECSLRASIFAPSIPGYDDLFTENYREIVQLSSEVVMDSKFNPSFTFDSGIVGPLFLAVAKCKEKGIREEAIRLLKMAGRRREGLWDSRLMAMLGEEILRRDEAEIENSSRGEGGSDDEKWTQIHLPCLNVELALPKPSGREMQGGRTGKGYLLGWVEKYMKVVALGEEDENWLYDRSPEY